MTGCARMGRALRKRCSELAPKIRDALRITRRPCLQASARQLQAERTALDTFDIPHRACRWAEDAGSARGTKMSLVDLLARAAPENATTNFLPQFRWSNILLTVSRQEPEISLDANLGVASSIRVSHQLSRPRGMPEARVTKTKVSQR